MFFQKTARGVNNANDSVTSTLDSLNVLISLCNSQHFNQKRFDTCRRLVQQLPLPKAQTQYANFLFENALRYVNYGEIGAVKFELRVLRKTLRDQLHH